MFAAPGWLRDLGVMSWLLVGVALGPLADHRPRLEPMGIPSPIARIVTQRTIQSLRGYFAGVTAVAAFNAILIGLGALVLGVPHVGAIALVNFIAAYIPYVGAWSAGAFTVLLTLGSQGSSAAVVMIVIVLLANGALQLHISADLACARAREAAASSGEEGAAEDPAPA